MKKVKLLGISASPRKGNSQYLLEKALECVPELPIPIEINKYSFSGKKIGACIGCLKCYENGGQCIIKDDFEEIRQMWIASDAVIYSVPVYVVGIPGQLKSLLDRLHNSFYGYYEVPSMRHLKVIGCIAQGGCMYGGQDLAIQNIILHAALINSVAISPDGSYIGAGGWTGQKSDKNAFRDRDNDGFDDAKTTIKVSQSVVRRVVETAAIIKMGAIALKDVIKNDIRYGPYLKRITEE